MYKMFLKKYKNRIPKIINLLKVPRFNTKKWIEVHDQSDGIYNTNKEITLKTSVLQSDLCVYSDEYIVIKGTITVGNNKRKL